MLRNLEFIAPSKQNITPFHKLSIHLTKLLVILQNLIKFNLKVKHCKPMKFKSLKLYFVIIDTFAQYEQF